MDVNAIRAVAVLFGAVYVIAGLAGFLPAFVTDEAPPTMPSAEGNLLGIFPINTAHNLVHIAIGAALLYGATATRTARMAARVVGIIYVGLAVLGLFVPDGFGLVPIGGADVLLHLVTAAVLLYIGFVVEASDSPTGLGSGAR